MQEVINKQIERLQSDIKMLQSHSMEAFYKACEDAKIEQFAWVQYSPHFNDGEACTFDVHEEMCNVIVADLPDDLDVDDLCQNEGMYDYNRNEAGGIDDWTRVYAHPNIKLADDFNWQEALGVTESTLEAMFGDGVKVTVDVKNRTMTPEDYDHD